MCLAGACYPLRVLEGYQQARLFEAARTNRRVLAHANSSTAMHLKKQKNSYGIIL
jgi:hypothetical protein